MPSLLFGVPLYCVSDNDNPPGGMYSRHSYLPAEAIALHHRDVQTPRRIALCWTTNEEAGFARAVLQHADAETPGEGR